MWLPRTILAGAHWDAVASSFVDISMEWIAVLPPEGFLGLITGQGLVSDTPAADATSFEAIYIACYRDVVAGDAIGQLSKRRCIPVTPGQ